MKRKKERKKKWLPNKRIPFSLFFEKGKKEKTFKTIQKKKKKKKVNKKVEIKKKKKKKGQKKKG